MVPRPRGGRVLAVPSRFLKATLTALAARGQFAAGGSWSASLPRPLVDPNSDDGPRQLRELFWNFADEHGRLQLEGLHSILELQRRADGISLSLPAGFTAVVFEAWRSLQSDSVERRSGMSEELFMRGYGVYFPHRENMLRHWLLESHHLPGPACLEDNAVISGICCNLTFGPEGYAACFDQFYSYERCCQRAFAESEPTEVAEPEQPGLLAQQWLTLSSESGIGGAESCFPASAKTIRADVCCNTAYGIYGYAPCFDNVFTFDRCCGRGAAEAAEKAIARTARALESRRTALEAARHRGAHSAVAPVERARAAFASCEEMSCSCTASRRTLDAAVSAAEGAAAPGRRPRLAVLVVGMRQRYYPLTTLRHVVSPAARAGYEVDYYVALNWNLSPNQTSAWSKQTYLAGGDRAPNPAFMNVTKVAFQEYVRRHALRYGARRSEVILADPGVSFDPLPEPPWRRFLGRDSRTHPTFVNYLLKLKKLEMLWNRTRNENYDRFVVVRDDVHWVDDIDLTDFPDDLTAYSPPIGFLCRKAHYAPSRLGGELPSEHVFVLGRDAAPRLLQAYTAYYETSNKDLDDVGSTEEFWLQLAKLTGVRWELVRRARLPYLLSMHQRLPPSDLPPKPLDSGRDAEAPPVFCLRGLSDASLRNPTDACVHPSRILHPFCEDLSV